MKTSLKSMHLDALEILVVKKCCNKKHRKPGFTIPCPLFPPLTISGAMYSIVPQNEYALPSCCKDKTYFETTKPKSNHNNFRQF